MSEDRCGLTVNFKGQVKEMAKKMININLKQGQLAGLPEAYRLEQNPLSKIMFQSDTKVAADQALLQTEGLKEAVQVIADPLVCTRLFCVSARGELRILEVFCSKQDAYVRLRGEENDYLTMLEGTAAEFTEGMLMPEGDPEAPRLIMNCTEDAVWTVLGVAEMKRRMYLNSMLTGEKIIDIDDKPIGALNAVAKDVFAQRTDYRHVIPFMQLFTGARRKPDSAKMYEELVQAGFLNDKGAVTGNGAYILNSLSSIHAMMGIQWLHLGQDNKTRMSTMAYFNCYHSYWCFTPETGDEKAMLFTLNREEIKHDLEEIYKISNSEKR